MKAVARIVGIVVLGIVVLGVGILFFLTRMFDPNDYKEHIQQAARDRANVELTLDGDIGWSLFPWLGIELKEVGVAPADQPEQPLARIGSLGLGVEVLPLLRRELRMSDVIVDSIALTLERNAEGVGNWESIGVQREVVQEEPVTVEPADTEAAERTRPLEISIESVRVTNASLQYTDQQAGRSVQMEDVNLSTGALIDGESFDLNLLGLVILDEPALRMRVDLRGVALFDQTQRRYQLDAVDLQLDASGTPFSGRAVTLQLRGDLLADLTEQFVELNQMRLSLADLRATGQLRASQLDSDMQLAGTLNVAQFDPKALLRSLGVDLPETRNPRALEQLSLQATLTGNANRLILDDLKMVLDGSELTGSAGLADIERQALRFRLTGDRLNIDDYLSPEDEQAGAPSPALPAGGARTDAPPPDWSDEPILPMDTLARLDVDGVLDLQQVQLTGQTVAPFRVSVLARDGRVRLRQFEGGAFGGQFALTGEIDSRATPVSLALKGKITSIDSLAVQQAYDTPPQFRGRLDLDADLRAAGNSMARWMSTLGGSARFTVNEGALMGVNVEQQLCQAIALANRRTLSEPRGSEDTPFRRLSGSFNIADGRVSGDDLQIALPGLAVRGRGNLLLPQQRIDYRLGVIIEGDKSEMPDPACSVNPRYAGIEWPIRCQGFLHNAARSCGVDAEGVTRIAGRLLGSEAQRKVEEAVQERLGDQAPAVRDAIRGLLGR
ncbi:AsmA family protein [Pseudomonas sp.]|uniref:AsmA family protein n=1 Tax=Pseudomonas sp. TaxID=306 RepID=UPI00272A9E09|nr:AsmA family protein [Pseudomonas sp.]